MTKLQKNYTLDNDSIQILEELGPRDKSEFIRKAIKFYHYNKDAKFEKPKQEELKVTILS